MRRTNLVLAVLALLATGVPAWAKPVRVLILGDSLTAGYGLPQPEGFQAQMAAALKASGHDVQMIDGAVSGDTSAGGRARLDWAIGDGVDAAFVALGANDGLRALDPGEMERNLVAILDALAAKKIPTLLSGMEAPPNMGADYATAFRAVFTRLGQRPGLLFDPFLLVGVAGDPAFNQGDRMHPNAEGVKKEVARLLPLFGQLLAKIPQ